MLHYWAVTQQDKYFFHWWRWSKAAVVKVVCWWVFGFKASISKDGIWHWELFCICVYRYCWHFSCWWWMILIWWVISDWFRTIIFDPIFLRGRRCCLYLLWLFVSF